MDTKTNGNAIDPSDKLGDIVTNNPSLAIELENVDLITAVKVPERFPMLPKKPA